MFIKNLGRCLFLTAIISSIALGDWKSDANTRIENIRKRNAQITLVNSLGQPVSGINVQIDQIKHRFGFGTCIRNSKMSDNNYKNFILDHFEWAVCENESKWAANEGTRDSETYTSADSIYTWCNSNGIKMRGHTLFWEQLTYVQSWVQSLPYATYPTSSELLDEVDERIDHAVAHFRNKFKHWDVDNEMLPTGSDYQFYNRLGEAGRVHMYQRARTVDPNCKLFLNEYSGNSFGGYDSAPYVSRASSLISMGAPIDGLGIQAHLGADITFDPQLYYNNVLQPLAALGKPIWATEFDASHTDATISADNIENFMRICFSHANVEGIMFWGFMNGQMWRTNAGLCDSSGNLTVQGQRYESLMDEWTTEDDGITDVDGNVDFRGFHGTYEITLTKTGQTTEVHTIELEPGSATQPFTIVTNLHSSEPEYIAPTPNPMTWASAPAATGPTTITMTATTATDDSLPVQYYFECTNDASKSSDWQTSTTYVAAGLNPNTLYTFRVKARDNAAVPNETGLSGSASATTLPPNTDVELIGSWVSGTTHAKENGSDRALLFIVFAEKTSTYTLNSVTYGGQTMEKVIDRAGGTTTHAYTAAYILKETGIAAATTTTFIPNWSTTPSEVSYESVFLSNVDQTTPVGPNDSNATSTSTPVIITTHPLSTTDGDMVIVGATCGNTSNYTVNNGFTEAIENDMASSTGTAGYKFATGVNETPSVTNNSVNRQSIIGFVVKAALPTYQDCDDVQNGGLGLPSDLNHDCYVNFKDLQTMSDYWLSPDCAANSNCDGADFQPVDGTVDFLDFSDFAADWMQCNDPRDSSCTQNW